MSTVNGNTEEKEFTHIMIVSNDANHPTPELHYSLKESVDTGKEIIKKNPDAQCDIYQIRTRLKGNIEIIETHYNTGKSE